jgi:hypothetical protein
MRLTILTCAALVAASPAFAQDEMARKIATEVATRVPLERALKGAPYSAETIVEGFQQLADGNRITRKTTGRVFRDSEGRTRREEDRPNGTVMVSITDPVAGFTYSLDDRNKIAWRTSMVTAGAIVGKIEAVQEASRTSGERQARTQGSADEPSLKAKIEERQVAEMAARGGGGRGGAVAAPGEPVVAPAGGGRGGRGGGAGGFVGIAPTMRGGVPGPLEHKTIEGLAVEGRKTTTTIPAGQVGNEQPLTIVSEQWTSPDLNVLVLTRHSDPRTGESTYRLVNIIRAEPDRSLFMVPPDYTVRDTAIRRMLEESARK